MRKSRAALRIVVFISVAIAVISFTACSVSNQSGNGGNGGSGGGGGGGNGGGTGGGNLACNGMSTGQTATLNGFLPFTSSNLWNTDISSALVDPNSGTIITNWVGSVNVHPDWGTDPSYGIPYVVVNGSQSLVKVNLQAYGDESDPGRCRFLPTLRLKADHPVRAIATCWCSTTATAFCTNSTIPP